MKSIPKLKQILEVAECNPREFFDADIDGRLKSLQSDCHPDRFSSDQDKLHAEILFKRFGILADMARKPPVTIKAKSREFILESLLATGDVSDVHLANDKFDRYVLKMSRVPGADKFLANEFDVIKKLNKTSGTNTYSHYFPIAEECIKATDGFRKQVNVFKYREGGFTLEQIAAKYPSGLKGEHLAWIYKRILTGIGYAHLHGYIHNAILPCHILIFPQDHGVMLVDWKFAGHAGVLKNISGKYRDYYPPEVFAKKPTNETTDIYMATKCILKLAGNVGLIPRHMYDYFRSAIFDSQRMRPQNAWQLMEDFSDMLQDLYGPPKFHELSMV